MPYCKKLDRYPFNDGIDMIIKAMNKKTEAGQLNYIISRIIRGYIKTKGESYQSHNDSLGALIGALLEHYRTKTGPMEDQKIIENGNLDD